MNAVIVNPGIILGPGFWTQSSGKLFATCYNGSPFYTEGTSATVDAQDVANCMIQLTENKHFNKRFVLIENNYSFKDILSQIHIALGKKAPIYNAGKVLLTFGKWFDGLRCLVFTSERLITKETINAALQQNTFDNSLVKQTLGHTFISFTDSVKFISQCYLNDLKK
jgi:nucleoside-diphosphate-sugar epimerase